MLENNIIPDVSDNVNLILDSVKILSEHLLQLKKDVKNCENYIHTLNNMLYNAEKDISSIQDCVDSMQTVGKQIVQSSLQTLPTQNHSFKSMKAEADNILQVLDEKVDFDTFLMDVKSIAPKKTSSSRCLDEKYPEHCSRDSFLDGNNIIVLPTVKEDVFADFNRPNRSVSSSSLKSLRKVKRYLQKVDDPDDVSFSEENDSLKRSEKFLETNIMLQRCEFQSVELSEELNHPCATSKDESFHSSLSHNEDKLK